MRSWIIFVIHLLGPLEITAGLQKEAIVTIQTKRWTHILSDQFLSLTLTPEVALELQYFSESTMNMLRGLSPTMMRLGGPSTDKMKFMPEKNSSDNFTITEEQWRRLNQFIEDVNMNLIVCLNSKERVHGVWESRNAVELIYSSNKNRYRLGWELGYESQNLLQDGVSGSQIGRDIARLKNILDDFPNYSDSPIIGPDMKSLSSHEEVRFLREYLEESTDFLTAITWHPQFSSLKAEDEDVNLKLQQIIHDMETLIWNKSNGLRSPIQPIPRKPIWIAESNSDEYTGHFADSLTWAKRIGAAARLGFPVIMKKLTTASLTTPTPDYWVSLLYKTLVGRAVLDVRYFVGNRTTLQVFSQCAEIKDKDSDSVLAPGVRYAQGSVVVYGLNLDVEETRLIVRGNVKEEPVHKYILTAAQLDQKMEDSDEEEQENRKRPVPDKTLLNGQLLSLLPSGELPTIAPVEMRSSRTLSVNIPGRSVFFLVLPEMKLKTCMSFTNMQDSFEKENVVEKSQSIKSTPVGTNGPEEDPGFIFASRKDENIESKTPTEKSWKSRFGTDLKEKLSDRRNTVKDLLVLGNEKKIDSPISDSEFIPTTNIREPMPKIRNIMNENRGKFIERENSMKNQIAAINQRAMKRTKQINEIERNLEGNEVQPKENNDQAITNTRFVMFSDDDWMSDFTKAKESVENARKAIAAFDEATANKTRQESSRFPQNSFEEQIMNQQMSPSRKRIYDALSAAIMNQRNPNRDGGTDRGPRHSDHDDVKLTNDSGDVKKVINRERRANVVTEFSKPSFGKAPMISSFNQPDYNKQIKEDESKDIISTMTSTEQNNKIIKTSIPTEYQDQIPEHANIDKSIPGATSWINHQDEPTNLNSECQVISSTMKQEEGIEQNENNQSTGIPDLLSKNEKIELNEMVEPRYPQEENGCFGQVDSNLKVVAEDGNQNEENDQVLKQKAERELNNYFQEISNIDVSSDDINDGHQSGSTEVTDDEALKPNSRSFSISNDNIYDKSCNTSFKKLSDESVNKNHSRNLKSEESGFDSQEDLNQSPISMRLDHLQGTDLPETELLSESGQQFERGRREMSIDSPFNYYDSRFMKNKLSLVDIKELIDELAARKEEVSYVMLKNHRDPKQSMITNRFEEGVTDNIDIDRDIDSIEAADQNREESTGAELIDVHQNTHNKNHNFFNDELNMNEEMETNRSYRQPQENSKTEFSQQLDSENVDSIGSSSRDDFKLQKIGVLEGIHDQDESIQTSTFLNPSISTAYDNLNDVNELRGEKHNQIERNSSLTLSVPHKIDNEESEDQLSIKTPEKIDGDVHLTEVNNVVDIPTTYSKVVTVMANDNKNVDRGTGLKASKDNKVFVGLTIPPKKNMTQVRLERIEALRNRLFENRRRINKLNLNSVSEKTPQVLKEVPIEIIKNVNIVENEEKKIPLGYLEEGAPTCKASRSAPYVEGVENWIDKIEKDSKETPVKVLRSQNALDKQNGSLSLNIFEGEIEDKGGINKIDPKIVYRPSGVTGARFKMNEVQNQLSTIPRSQGSNSVAYNKKTSPFIIIPTSYAIMPIGQKYSHAPKKNRDSRSHSVISDNVNSKEQLINFEDGKCLSEENPESFFTGTNESEEENRDIRTITKDVMKHSFPLVIADSDMTERFLKSYGREKRSTEDNAESQSSVKEEDKGLLGVKGLNRRNFGGSDKKKIKILSPKLSFEQIRTKALARLKDLRQSFENSRLKIAGKSRETRAINPVEGDRKVKGRSVLSILEDLKTNEIPKQNEEYVNRVLEPSIDIDRRLSPAEFENKINGYKSYQRAPANSRKSNRFHFVDSEVATNAGEDEVITREYMNNDYIAERMSRTDKAVVGLKHSVEELENTAKEILDKVSISGVKERKKPWIQEMSGRQSVFGLERPRETKRMAPLSFLNPIIDIVLKFMRSIGIIS